eukprot:CAMPEP_0116007348 /NCGR_PEP_ID=MMETSP0321-20121206/2249_1 /TAXON_ID=163516 /ORGANISM="Leptocylindrus danicus var. danicus, Strain B650" /LENGTH=124 /DNA_ID=CAMNT_0003476033 /DNA_START=90 /DNA_END=464 /DNA_ORIENTATION=+
MSSSELYDYDSEMNYERTHLSFDPWGTPFVFTMREECVCTDKNSEKERLVVAEMLRRGITKAWLDDLAAAERIRQQEITVLRQRTSLPRDNRGYTKNKRRLQRRLALVKEENWRNEKTMQLIEN